jgi:murein DD-endopeptidase MepM/ murein hydrolase activator NlpD
MTTLFTRVLMVSAACGALTACSPQALDWDLRGMAGGPLDTRAAALTATTSRPAPDQNGVLSYPSYQVALARRGDTVATVAQRIGLDPVELGRTNALKPDDLLRTGEVLSLPRRVASNAGPIGGGQSASGAIQSGTIAPSAVEVTTLAGAALDRTSTAASSGNAGQTATQPGRHRVARGETAYSIARLYNVNARSLADWNGLGPDLSLREGQYLLIPTPVPGASSARSQEPLTVPGSGTPTPIPPSAATALPAEKTAPAAQAPDNVPQSPNLGQSRSTAAAFGMPVQGKIIRGFVKGKNDGIDVAAAAGTTVVAAADGEVAAVTKNTDQVVILVIRHPNNVLTVYGGIDGVKVTKGAKVKRGQPVAVVRKADPAFLHFEIRKGVDAVDPVSMLQ